ncbi:MAG: hypothetical protein VB085_08915 [Peptococcaceae bacterium]|nr:hypothetical protein [Peptococcaceae bacterium]
MHEANIGSTGSGKTFQALRQGLRNRERIIYINPKPRKGAAYSDISKGFFRAWPDEIDRSDISDILGRGMNLEFIPDSHVQRGMEQLRIVVDEAFRLGNVTMIFDEAAVHSPEGCRWSPAIEVAERGREAKVKGVFICQSPSALSKRVLTNCDILRIFRFNLAWAGPYLKSKGLEPESLSRKLLTASEYSYIIMEGGNITEPKKER